MREFKYKQPRVHNGDLRTPVKFYEFVPKTGPEPGEDEKEELHSTFAKIDTVWAKDLEQAKATGTVEDLTITIRDPFDSYRPSNKHYIEIDDLYYEEKKYNVKHVQPDLNNKDFIKVIARLVK